MPAPTTSERDMEQHSNEFGQPVGAPVPGWTTRPAALRLGVQYEGLFRQATITRGRNRDTAWFSVIDSDWPALRAAFERWLDPANFDARGQQRQSLASFRPQAQ